MAEIRKTVDKARNLTTFTVSGKVAGEELMEAMTAFLTGEATLLSLWDCTDVDDIEISSEQIGAFVDDAKRLGEARRGGRTAWVVPTQFGYGLGRMATILSELRDVPFEAQVFRSLDEAKRWLGVN